MFPRADPSWEWNGFLLPLGKKDRWHQDSLLKIDSFLFFLKMKRKHNDEYVQREFLIEVSNYQQAELWCGTPPWEVWHLRSPFCSFVIDSFRHRNTRCSSSTTTKCRMYKGKVFSTLSSPTQREEFDLSSFFSVHLQTYTFIKILYFFISITHFVQQIAFSLSNVSLVSFYSSI